MPADDELPTTPTDVEAERRLGDELLRARWFSRAAVHYGRYLGRRPYDTKVLSSLGLALFWGGDLDHAIPALQQAVAGEPDTGITQLALASALFDKRRDIREVVAHARRGAALLPSDPQAQVMLGRALAVSGELNEAAHAVQHAIDLDPNHADAHELLRTIRQVAESP
jgi:predicted Zn-dependent protease